MTGLDCRPEGSSFAGVSPLGYDEEFLFELVRISIVPLSITLDSVLLEASLKESPSRGYPTTLQMPAFVILSEAKNLMDSGT
jgi:hypothetical protein